MKGFMEQVEEAGSVANLYGFNVEELRMLVARMKKMKHFVKYHPVLMFLSRSDYDALCDEMDGMEEFGMEEWSNEEPRVSARVGGVLILFIVFETEENYALMVPVTNDYPNPSMSLKINKIQEYGSE